MKQKLTALFLLLALLLGGCACPPYSNPSLESTGSGSPKAADTLQIHFIDVGQADCALIEYGDFYMLIDGGNQEDGQLVVSYLEQQGVECLSAVVCTHAHEDHVGGLPSVLAVYPTQAVYAPTRTYASNIFDDFMYYVDQQGLEVTIPEPGDGMRIGDLEITVLGPVKSYADTNNTSIVLRIDYGETSFLFTGDMETTAENDLLDAGGSVDADVLKVGHHGSNTSSGYRFLYEVSPAYAVISVGEGNSYGHPHEEPVSRLIDAGCTIFRTDQMGTILATSDGSGITFTWQNQNATPANLEAGAEKAQSYIGNINSGKFHSVECANLPAEKNRTYFDSYQDAVDAGYSPCGSCLG